MEITLNLNTSSLVSLSLCLLSLVGVDHEVRIFIVSKLNAGDRLVQSVWFHVGLPLMTSLGEGVIKEARNFNEG